MLRTRWIQRERHNPRSATLQFAVSVARGAPLRITAHIALGEDFRSGRWCLWMPRRSTVKGSGVLHGRCAAAGSPQLSSILVYARQEMTHFGNQTAFTMQVCARQSRAQFALLS